MHHRNSRFPMVSFRASVAVAIALLASPQAGAQNAAVIIGSTPTSSQVMVPSDAFPPAGGPVVAETGPIVHGPSVAPVVLPRSGYCGEVWEASTRHLPCCLTPNLLHNPPIRYSQLVGGRWVRRSEADWLASPVRQIAPVHGVEQLPLVIFYVHGNWMTVENARERVAVLNQAIARQARRPYQIIMLSWPSQREPGAVRDIRENAECADVQAHYLNYMLRQLDPSVQVSLLGFSFGGRTVTGALHLAAGGTIEGYCSQCLPWGAGDVLGRYRVTVVAPAVDNDSMTPTGKFNRAIEAVNWMVNLYNSKDRALRRFEFIDRLARPIAAGFRGFESVANPRSTSPLATLSVVEQLDCGGAVGPTHDEMSYFSKCPYFRRGVENLLWQFPAPAAAPGAVLR